MSKQPAWNAYNKAVLEANEEYDKSVKPLRVKLSDELAATEKRFSDKIEPLILERDTITKKLKESYSDKVMEAEKKRRDAIKRAHDVRVAELSALPPEEKKKEPAHA